MNQMIKIFLFLIFSSVTIYAQVTGLSGWNIFLDPGHSQDENMGIYGYSEAKKVLRVGLRLQELLLNTTDIDTVYISRTNDQQSVSLSQRTTHANNVGAAWYHSIHSDAGDPSYNSTLLLWGQLYDGTPDPPVGGEAMSDIIVDILTRGYRTSTRGSIGDCSFYTWSTYCQTSGGPYLYVNRYTNMPSELSESGFHTNPTQNQRNMNAEWKKLEAYTFYWSFLKFHGITRPTVGIATGIISDIESNIPINGATVTLNTLMRRSYTTDTYASLFHLYSSDPDQLHNGFYFFENLPINTFDMYLEAPDYYSDTVQVSIIDTFFTFKDVKLISTVPPKVTSTTPADGDTNFSGYDNIFVEFSRNMDRISVENAFALSPATTGSFYWYSDKKIRFNPDSLEFETNYTLTISGAAEDAYGHFLDGDSNGVGGDDFTLTFKTGPSDIFAPDIVSHYPASNQTEVEIQPIINVLYDEELDSASVVDSLFDLSSFADIGNPVSVDGILEHRVINEQSLVSFYPDYQLDPAALHRINILSGFRDLLGNSGSSTTLYSLFTTAGYEFNITEIDDFEGGSITTNWWQPQGSGSTTGILTLLTSVAENYDYLNLTTNSTTSMQLNYGWNMDSTYWLIREHLPGGPPKNVHFDTTYTLQCYIFGDGSNTKFRFSLDENDTGAPPYEVSNWINIDWVGWRLVEWKLSDPNTIGYWAGLGNGIMDGSTYVIESLQFSYEPGGYNSGTIYLDDLRLATKISLGTPDAQNGNRLPEHYQLFQNYPNPFNPSTTIKYQVPQKSHVKITVYNMLGQVIKILVNEEKSAGVHDVKFNTENLAGGIYIYTLETNSFKDSKKMMLVK